MEHKLIDELCAAFSEWAKQTGDEISMPDYAMMSSGGFVIKRQGSKEDADPRSNADTKYGDIAGRYTIDQVRNYLGDLVENHLWLEDKLVHAVVVGITDELDGYVSNADAAAERLRSEARDLREAVSSSLGQGTLLDFYVQDFSVNEDVARQALLHMAELSETRAEQIPLEVPRNVARLQAWEAVSGLLITRERRSQCRAAQFKQYSPLFPDEQKKAFGKYLQSKYGGKQDTGGTV